MKTSESVTNIFSALVKFRESVPTIPKNKTVEVKTSTGGSYTFNYADFEQIVTTISPILKDNKLSFIQINNDEGLNTIIIHESWEWIDCGAINIVPTWGKNTAQEIGSGLTYASRYGLRLAFGLVAEDDDDGNTAVGNSVSYVDRVELERQLNQVTEADDATKQWIKPENITAFVKLVADGKYECSSPEIALKMAYRLYKISRENAEIIKQKVWVILEQKKALKDKVTGTAQ